MFRRKWSGLPPDPDFPTGLKELGYFVNEDDEIRSIQDPQYYFKYFLCRNSRWNDRQRYAMNQSIQQVIWERLEGLGLKKQLLPLGVTDPATPHVPIFVSGDIARKSRVVVIFGETMQDLGVLAFRVAGGHGGVNKGSVVSIVAELQKQRSSASDAEPPGVVLANMGELIWLPQAQRTLSILAFNCARMKSAVHKGRVVTPGNLVPGNETPKAHVNYIFNDVLPHLVNDRARLDIITVGDSAEFVEQYLDLPPVWQTWHRRINCLAIVGGQYAIWDLNNQEFKEFLKNKARAYTTSFEPAGMVLSGPEGNPKTTAFTQIGCPVFSSGEPHYTECTLVASGRIVLDWLHEVATTPDGEDYSNPEFQIIYADPPAEEVDGVDWSRWKEEDAAAEEKKGEGEEKSEKKEGHEGDGK
ncbi:hypothetical protein GGS23DRAFT_612772 [Durotheca rogersii]|uniref:uncharacterized protein n=1 Tax=Durotheca rogersii TaxID=419775 RepID=UPI0022210D7C|nr:uncharacterized protein GGS23DRAFT_612772 [Durotheca rogersii]KAI5867633.1 hypothetical protein GGS23DRAFT_612772 [Durotheca rogersii]